MDSKNPLMLRKPAQHGLGELGNPRDVEDYVKWANMQLGRTAYKVGIAIKAETGEQKKTVSDATQ